MSNYRVRMLYDHPILFGSYILLLTKHGALLFDNVEELKEHLERIKNQKVVIYSLHVKRFYKGDVEGAKMLLDELGIL